jgi:hypothetical protein
VQLLSKKCWITYVKDVWIGDGGPVLLDNLCMENWRL